ncbi:MAG TPA: hypothetical protein VEV81_10795 [Pyrinomonadaceae bacterium]|nr:hypothetical protein [Pyrinomonadaceae bacterium]
MLPLLLCVEAFGQGRDLQLATDIVGQRYCAVGAQVDALQLRLRLRYTNTGSQKLILYRGNKLFYQIFVGRNVEDLEDRRYETRTTHSRFYDEQPEKIDLPAPGSVFVTLPPGASYESEQVVALPVARGDHPRTSDTLAPGEHVLQMVVSTWYESKGLAQTLRERWQRRGFLWTDLLAAQGVNFQVAKNPSAVVCR